MGQLFTDATTIKNETARGAITPNQVGSWMEDAATAIETSQQDIINLEAEKVQEIVYVREKADFGEFVSGVATLQDGFTYVLIGDIDLDGGRLVTDGDCNLIGTGTETSSLTSDGLANGVPLISTDHNLVIKDITLIGVNTCFSYNEQLNSVVVVLEGVNFRNIPNLGTIDSPDNILIDTCGVFNSKGMVITGTVGTVAINNSLFVGDGQTGSIIQLDASCVITRRFRAIYSSFVVNGNTVGINASTSANIPVEGYVLDTINFSGNGTYLSGLTFSSEKSLFTNCVGVKNSTAIAGLYMLNNSTPTRVAESGTPYAVEGGSVMSDFSQKFFHVSADNSVRYLSTIPRLMSIQASFTFTGSNGNVIAFYIGVKKGSSIDPSSDLVPESEILLTASGNKPDAGFIQAVVELEQGDEVYLILENKSIGSDITVQFMHLIASRTN